VGGVRQIGRCPRPFLRTPKECWTGTGEVELRPGAEILRAVVSDGRSMIWPWENVALVGDGGKVSGGMTPSLSSRSEEK
jgi:hypothetical protein